MLYLGIDLGATNIGAALVDETGRIIRQGNRPTRVGREAHEIIQDIAELSLGLLEDEGLLQNDVTAVGIGIPGLADFETGIVHRCPNLFWEEIPLKEILHEWLSLPIYITNDANCAALAELYLGALKGRQNGVLITLGSGIGGGVILSGRIYTGAHGAAGEIGHMILQLDGEPCSCGNYGCFERYASANALIRMAQETLKTNSDSLMLRKTGLLAGSNAGVNVGSNAGSNVGSNAGVYSDTQHIALDYLTAQIVVDAAREGDPVALQVFDEYLYNLSRGIVSIINLYDPEVVALGGGLSHAGEFLLFAVREEVANHLSFKGFQSAEIVLATLGNEAGVIGAAMFAQGCWCDSKEREILY